MYPAPQLSFYFVCEKWTCKTDGTTEYRPGQDPIYIWFPYSRMMDYRKSDHVYHLHLYCTNLFQSETIFQIDALNKRSSVGSIWIFHYRGVILLEVRCAANILSCSQTNMVSVNLELLWGLLVICLCIMKTTSPFLVTIACNFPHLV